jgi:hypothetical protein
MYKYSPQHFVLPIKGRVMFHIHVVQELNLHGFIYFNFYIGNTEIKDFERSGRTIFKI